MMMERRKEGFVRGCLVPMAAVIGMLAVCFVACFVLFQLNQASMQQPTFSLLFGG